MPPNEQQLLDNFRDLPAAQQSQVVDFVEFLKAKRSVTPAIPTGQSFLEAAGGLIGCLDGPGDLSTNPKYFEGFGRDRQAVLAQLNQVYSAQSALLDPTISALQYSSLSHEDW